MHWFRAGKITRVFYAALGVILLSLLLSACGFSPLFGGGRQTEFDTTARQLLLIEVAPIAGRNGQILRQRLEQDLNPRGHVSAKPYRLTVSLSTETADFVDDSRTIRAMASYRLIEKKSTEILFKGQGFGFGRYVGEGDRLLRDAQREKAVEGALALLSQDIVLRLNGFFLNRLRREEETSGVTPEITPETESENQQE